MNIQTYFHLNKDEWCFFFLEGSRPAESVQERPLTRGEAARRAAETAAAEAPRRARASGEVVHRIRFVPAACRSLIGDPLLVSLIGFIIAERHFLIVSPCWEALLDSPLQNQGLRNRPFESKHAKFGWFCSCPQRPCAFGEVASAYASLHLYWRGLCW